MRIGKLSQMKNYTFYIIIIASLFLTSCFTYYKKYDKNPCNALQDNKKEGIKKLLLDMRYKEDDILLSENYVMYKYNKIEFSNVKKIIMATKSLPKGKRYTLKIFMKSGDGDDLYTFDYDIAIKAYTEIECLAGITEKPKKTETAPNDKDKYDSLIKLKYLLDTGALTKAEYDREKRKLLGEDITNMPASSLSDDNEISSSFNLCKMWNLVSLNDTTDLDYEMKRNFLNDGTYTLLKTYKDDSSPQKFTMGKYQLSNNRSEITLYPQGKSAIKAQIKFINDTLEIIDGEKDYKYIPE